MTEPAPKPVATSRRSLLVAVVVLGACLLAAGWIGRSWLYSQADPGRFDSSPLPRVPKNAPFIKTPDTVTERIIELAGIGPDDLVYDLGCGDGRLVITAAAKTGCRGVGFDIDPERVAEAKENARIHAVDDRVTIEQKDIFTLDLAEADVVLMYLLPWMNKKLIPQLEQLKPGARIVSHEFDLGDITPDESIRVQLNDVESRVVHLWLAPLDVPATMREEATRAAQ